MTGSGLDFKTPLLVLGGARSGKSAWAESVINQFTPPYVYMATSQPLDEEMKLRIQLHRDRRGGGWETIESPIHLGPALKDLMGGGKPVLVDCITIWLSNLMCSAPAEAESEADLACSAIQSADYPLVIVSNEVGSGIVPDNPLGRKFRDLSGFTNQRLARICNSVFLITAGLPLRLK